MSTVNVGDTNPVYLTCKQDLYKFIVGYYIKLTYWTKSIVGIKPLMFGNCLCSDFWDIMICTSVSMPFPVIVALSAFCIWKSGCFSLSCFSLSCLCASHRFTN